jgi:hypothetical protein
MLCLKGRNNCREGEMGGDPWVVFGEREIKPPISCPQCTDPIRDGKRSFFGQKRDITESCGLIRNKKTGNRQGFPVFCCDILRL